MKEEESTKLESNKQNEIINTVWFICLLIVLPLIVQGIKGQKLAFIDYVVAIAMDGVGIMFLTGIVQLVLNAIKSTKPLLSINRQFLTIWSFLFVILMLIGKYIDIVV